MGGPDMAPHTPRPAPGSSWGLDRVSEPEGAPSPPPAPRSSWGLDRVSEPDTAGGSSRPGGAVALLGIPRAPAGLLEDGLELELAPDRRVRLHHFEAGHRVVVDVTVLVEAPLAVDALEVLRGRDRFAQGLALLGDVLRALQLRRGPADRVDDDPGALGRVERVRGRLLAELRLVRLVRLGADAPHLLERQAGERDPHVRAEGGVARGAFQQLLLEEPVRSQEAGPRRDEADLLHLSDHDLGARLDDAAQIDEVGARRADLRQHRLLVGLLPVDALVGDDRQSDLLGGRLEDVGDPFAVELLVVEDVDLLDAETLGPLRAHRALDVVGRDRAEIVREPARTVDLRLAGGGPALLGQSGAGVGRRDLGHAGGVGGGEPELAFRALRGVGIGEEDGDTEKRDDDGRAPPQSHGLILPDRRYDAGPHPGWPV